MNSYLPALFPERVTGIDGLKDLVLFERGASLDQNIFDRAGCEKGLS